MGNSIKRLEYENPKEVDDKYHLIDDKKINEKNTEKKINDKKNKKLMLKNI